MGLNGGIRAPGNNQRICRGQLERLLIIGVGLGKVAAGCIKIAQGQIGNVIRGIGCGKPIEIQLCGLGVAFIAGEVSHGFERVPVFIVALEQVGIHLPGFAFAAHLPEQAAVLQRHVVAYRIDLQGFLKIGLCAVHIITQGFNRGPQAQIFNPLGTFHLKLGQCLPRDLQLLGYGSIITGVFVSLDQIKAKLRGIKNSFSRALGHGGQCGQIFADGISITALSFSEVTSDRVQPVVLGVELLSTS